jgi:hypothetical protein
MSESLLLVASTSRIFAPGAIACAHRTSSVISSAQPTWFGSVGSKVGTPCGAIAE